jgi:3'-phosphoadenosine 5'-phosphosulfate sulfotransferase (PAPS reductase)/FAD synthetase
LKLVEPRDFVRDWSIRSLVVCLSGGKDSLAAAHYTLSQVANLNVKSYVVFVDTTVMIPTALPFVKETCARFGWPLQILRPRDSFWELVGDRGYPMPTMRRRWCCYKLKLEPIMNFTHQLPRPRAEVTGLRRDESVRRRGLAQLFFLRSGQTWKYAPIIAWTEADVTRYIRDHDLPMPPHYRLGIRETCLCGAFSSEAQMMCVKAQFPDLFTKFLELESGFRSHGAAFYFHNRPHFAREIAAQQTLEAA